jgi:hypothetical protein
MARVEDVNGHWMWRGALNHAGYGRFAWTTNRTVAAHRASWMRHRGEIPPSMQLHHTCYIRACVNPDHLELVTPKFNTVDRSAREGPRKPRSPNRQLVTVCKNGHPMDGDNVAFTVRKGARWPRRYCRTCAYESNQRQRARRAAH